MAWTDDSNLAIFF